MTFAGYHARGKNQAALWLLAGWVLCAFPFLFSSCQATPEEENSTHRIADYFVRYLAAERQLKAYASFYEGDSIRTATPQSIQGGVTFQGAEMERRVLGKQGIRYTVTRTADYAPTLQFAHQNLNGQRMEQTFEMASLDIFYFEGEVSRQRGATLVIEGSPLEASESLVLLFSDANDRAYSITLAGGGENNRFALSPAQLRDIPLGSSQLYIVRKKSEVREQPHLTVLVAIEYYSPTVRVEILP